MAQPKSVKHASTAVRPLSSRPLDMIYYWFFAIHLVLSLAIDLLPVYPAQFQTWPILKQVFAFFKAVVDDYTKKTNDPFMLATWGLVQRPWEFHFMNVFMWMEVPIQIPGCIIGMYALQKEKKALYPVLLAYTSAALVTTTTVIFVAFAAPSAHDKTLDPVSKFYAMTEEGRWSIIYPTIPYLVIPAIMWVDMMVRITSLVKAGAKAQNAAIRVENGKKLH
ncbi:hypothetical protein FRC19_009102 [Serendipita sp. 401]|nr:hypothetical protein FRC19_009102 [Serendipita sp. 401]KAG9046462.1 hypothetical protein FS842_000865 [Serendipita sp. 407]